VIVTPQIVVRLALIVLITVLLQFGFFSQVPILGSVANLLPVVVVSLGLLGGAVTGSVIGFVTGLLIDVLIGGTLGVASLSLMAAGYLAGRWREGYDIVSSLVPPLLAGALTALTALAYGLLTLTLGVDAPVSILALREVLVQGLLGILLAIPVFPLIRRAVRPALVDDAGRARSRAAGRAGKIGRHGGTFGMMRGQGSV
jgi:rod shape-determining protein MreD